LVVNVVTIDIHVISLWCMPFRDIHVISLGVCALEMICV
jgi:hypothetical protein